MLTQEMSFQFPVSLVGTTTDGVRLLFMRMSLAAIEFFKFLALI